MYRIFIVEDDTIIASEIEKYLMKWGYEVKCASNFNDIITEFIKYDPQLVLMDISLPFYNGYYWCKEIRKISKIPIIFISSAKDNMNILMAISMGGDDFISKPFELSVLSAKIQAMLRRSYSYNEKNNYKEYKGVLFNTSDASLIYKEEKIELTKNEFKIIQILFENIGEIVSREQIMKKLWDNECFVDDNTLTVNITRLRKKLENAGIKDFIKTKKGLGYIIGE
ncbi:response regulator transcription factor [Defluviitalea phaphyphila]|uniref:response regulator transcription factor n=1 Tax=Defluviitalea phaphyphila TaxID=1473580 RepID=UPI00072FB1FE|nr:response regulator transcription factor [Defluviitalea phaphyphila]